MHVVIVSVFVLVSCYIVMLVAMCYSYFHERFMFLYILNSISIVSAGFSLVIHVTVIFAQSINVIVSYIWLSL